VKFEFFQKYPRKLDFWKEQPLPLKGQGCIRKPSALLRGLVNNVSVPHIVKRVCINNISVPYIVKRACINCVKAVHRKTVQMHYTPKLSVFQYFIIQNKMFFGDCCF